MLPGEIKPLLSSLVLPPGGLLLLALFGLLWHKRRWGLGLSALALLSLWLLSCQGFAVLLSQSLLPTVNSISPDTLKTRKVQAIVVLGGGIDLQTPEYGQSQLSAASLTRLRYGAHLARQTGLPLAFSGGIGWAAIGVQQRSEAAAARQALSDWGLPLRWEESASHDTAENATLSRQLMKPDGIQRIALVTHAWHMPRARQAFEAAGFEVTAAPMGFVQARYRGLLEWQPSGEGLDASRSVLREWLGLQVAALSSRVAR